jgi:non-heme chloroperoxidase
MGDFSAARRRVLDRVHGGLSACLGARLGGCLPLAAGLARPAAAQQPQPAPPAVAPALPTQRRFPLVTSDRVRLSVLEAAPAQPDASQPTIVLVPGWCMPASIWQSQLESLGAQFRTLALDPRGQGDSEVPAGGYDADRRALDLQELLAAQAAASAASPGAVLVGWSLGVLEALQLVYRFGSEHVAGLVLVDNSVGEPPAPKPSNLLAQLRADRVATTERFVRAMFARPQPPERIEQLKRAALRMPLADAIALLSYPFAREHWRDIARSFDKPLCYCVTSRYLEQARNLQKDRPATQVEWFEGAGHALFVDQPDRFNRVITDFVASLSAGSAHT